MDFKPQPALIFLGRPGSGKSHLANMITKSKKFDVNDDLSPVKQIHIHFKNENTVAFKSGLLFYNTQFIEILD